MAQIKMGYRVSSFFALKIVSWLAVIMAFCGASSVGLGFIQAQGTAFPPWPVIYQGEVYVDGVLLEETTELVVRIGEWESNPVVVQNGRFMNLVAGPPSQEFDGLPITFWMGGLEAHQRFQFEIQAEPKSQILRLGFGEESVPELSTGNDQGTDLDVPQSPVLDTGSNNSLVWVMMAGLAVVVLIGAIFVAMRRRSRTN